MMRSAFLRLRRFRVVRDVIAGGLGLCLSGAAIAGQQPRMPEYTVKAGFLTAFMRYATWPAGRFASAADPLTICVVGRDPFGEVLDRTAAETRAARPIAVRRLATPRGAEGCHLLFISREERSHEAEWITSLRALRVLVVGESGDTLARGGAIEFATIGDRVVFDVNLRAASSARVRLGADMLSRARKVER